MRRNNKSTTKNYKKNPNNYKRTPKAKYKRTPIRQPKKQTNKSSIKRNQKKSYERKKTPTIRQKTPYSKINSKKKPKQQPKQQPPYEQRYEQTSTSSYFMPLQSRSKKEITSTPRILCDQNKRQAILKNSVKYILTPGKLKTRNTPFKTPSSRRKKTCIQQIGQMYRELTTPKTPTRLDYCKELSEPDLMSFTPIKTPKSKTFTNTNFSKPLFFDDNQNSLI